LPSTASLSFAQLAAPGHAGSEGLTRRIVARALVFAAFEGKMADGSYKQVPHSVVMQYVEMVIEAHFRVGAPVLTDPARLRDFVLLELGRREGEVFAVILLNSRGRFIEYVELFHGTDAAEVKAQPLLDCILQHKASQVIFVHNHVSGRCRPSMADLTLTDRWRKALGLFNVKLVDHLVVGEGVYSLAEQGHLQ
jgi:DNA repair protein RadC